MLFVAEQRGRGGYHRAVLARPTGRGVLIAGILFVVMLCVFILVMIGLPLLGS
jgi:hypothetical protein